MELVELGVCSVKSIDCMKGQCDECPRKRVVSNICEELEKRESLSKYRWVNHQNSVHKIQDEVTGEEAAILLADLVDRNKMKMHKYNICHQFSELNYLDEESSLVKFPVVIISNETKHDRNVAFSSNNQLRRMVKDMARNIPMFHFWKMVVLASSDLNSCFVLSVIIQQISH